MGINHLAVRLGCLLVERRCVSVAGLRTLVHVTEVPMSVLSHREQDVLSRAAEGLSNAQIAAQLSISTHAVKFHLASVYRKLGVANRTEAATRYVGSLAGGVALRHR